MGLTIVNNGIPLVSTDLPPVAHYLPGTQAYTTDQGLLVNNGIAWIAGGNPFIGMTSAESSAGVSINTFFEPYDLRRYGAVGDGITDDTAAINRWITVAQLSGVGFIYPLVYNTTGGHTITQRFNWIARGGGEYVGVTPRFRLTAPAVLMFNWNGLNNTGPQMNGMLVQGVSFNAGSNATSDCMVAMQGMALITFRDCGFHNANGNCVRMRQFWDSLFDNCQFRSNDASGAQGVIYIDSHYNNDDAQNVNNLTFFRCHFEINKGSYFFAKEDSNLSIFRLVDTKMEHDITQAGTFPFMNLKEASIVQISRNVFINIQDTLGYPTIFKLGDTTAGSSCSGYEVVDNTFNNVAFTSSTAYIDTQGTLTEGTFERNISIGNNVLGAVANSSTRACRFEYPMNQATQSDFLQSYTRTQSALNGFTSVSYLGVSSAMSTDSTSLSVTKTVVASAAAITVLVSFPRPVFAGLAGSLRIGVRCKSATGAGTIRLNYNASFTAEQNPPTSFGTLWFEVAADQLALIANSGNQFRLTTGAANAETVTVDGVYFQQVPWHYSTTFTYDPPSLGTGTGTTTTVAITNAAIGDHLDVYPPYDLQGLMATAAASSAGNATLSIFNPTVGTVNLASGTWMVRGTRQ
jgi:hypothetical protein